MLIGKTSSVISKAEIFDKVGEVQILTTVFPEITMLPCLINSPLREDSKPSFSIYLTNNNHVRYKDHAIVGEQGTLLDLLCKYWKCSFREALDRVCNLFVSKSDIQIKPKKIQTFTRKEINNSTTVQVAVRPWRKYDYEYWASYGIEPKWLHYAEVYPISHKIVTIKTLEGKTNKHIFSADKYAYVFVERKEGKVQLKIYQPYNKKGYKWCSKMDRSVIGLWSKIPERGERVIIASSLKDVLVLSCQLHIPAICLQGEGYGISDTAIKELKRRFSKVYISFDTDKAGITDAKKLSEETGFTNVIPDLKDCKDYSDAYKAYGKEWFIENIKPLFM